MATFTLELREVLDLKPKNVSDAEFLKLTDYPLYDLDYRDTLNRKIIEHFWFQEIGRETVEEFTFALRRTMNEVMPAYNELYRSKALEFDPFVTMVIESSNQSRAKQSSEGESVGETTSLVDSKAKNVVSNFPQVRLSDNKDYASNAADTVSDTETTGESAERSKAANDSEQESTATTKGYQGSPSQLLAEFRSTIINVDMMIIAELDPLFMTVWNNSDEYFAGKGRIYF